MKISPEFYKLTQSKFEILHIRKSEYILDCVLSFTDRFKIDGIEVENASCLDLFLWFIESLEKPEDFHVPWDALFLIFSADYRLAMMEYKFSWIRAVLNVHVNKILLICCLPLLFTKPLSNVNIQKFDQNLTDFGLILFWRLTKILVTIKINYKEIFKELILEWTYWTEIVLLNSLSWWSWVSKIRFWNLLASFIFLILSSFLYFWKL